MDLHPNNTVTLDFCTSPTGKLVLLPFRTIWRSWMDPEHGDGPGLLQDTIILPNNSLLSLGDIGRFVFHLLANLVHPRNFLCEPDRRGFIRSLHILGDLCDLQYSWGFVCDSDV